MSWRLKRVSPTRATWDGCSRAWWAIHRRSSGNSCITRFIPRYYRLLKDSPEEVSFVLDGEPLLGPFCLATPVREKEMKKAIGLGTCALVLAGIAGSLGQPQPTVSAADLVGAPQYGTDGKL